MEDQSTVLCSSRGDGGRLSIGRDSWFFSREDRSKNCRAGNEGFPHLQEFGLQEAFNRNVRRAIPLPCTPASPRCHPFPRTNLLHSDCSGISGSSDASITAILTHVLMQSGRGIRSPADILRGVRRGRSRRYYLLLVKRDLTLGQNSREQI